MPDNTTDITTHHVASHLQQTMIDSHHVQGDLRLSPTVRTVFDNSDRDDDNTVLTVLICH